MLCCSDSHGQLCIRWGRGGEEREGGGEKGVGGGRGETVLLYPEAHQREARHEDHDYDHVALYSMPLSVWFGRGPSEQALTLGNMSAS